MRLVEVAERAGANHAQLVQNAGEIPWNALDGHEGPIAIGLSAGASAPEILVEEIVETFRSRYGLSVELAETTVEDEEFLVIRDLRDVPLEAADMAFVNGAA